MTDGMRLQRKYHCSVEVSAADYCIQELPRNFQVKIFVEKGCCVELGMKCCDLKHFKIGSYCFCFPNLYSGTSEMFHVYS